MIVLLCLLGCVSSAFASSADSGRCPWKLPFSIKLHANGQLFTSKDEIPTHGPTHHSTSFSVGMEDILFVIDTAQSSVQGVRREANLSIYSDTLRFYSHVNDSGGGRFHPAYLRASIAFVPHTDSIYSIDIEQLDTITEMLAPLNEADDRFSFQISELRYDDTSIYASSPSVHRLRIEHSHADITYAESRMYPEFGVFIRSNFTADSADISGLFQNAHYFEDVAADVRPDHSKRISAGTIILRKSEGAILRLSETERDNASSLQIYAISGELLLHKHLPPHTMFVDVGELPRGLYIARLDGQDIRLLILP